MANEFKVKNGLISEGDLTVTGSITATGGIILSGSVASASYAANAELLDGLDSTVFVLTSSFNSVSSSLVARVTNLESTASILTAASASLSTASGSLNAGLTNVIARTGSFATTGSNVFYGAQTVSASMFVSGGITATGQIIAQTLNVQQVTSSIVYSSGSNIFGSQVSDTQQFTGSMLITGSTLTVTGGTICATGNSCVGGMSIVNSCLGIGTASPNNILTLYSPSSAIYTQWVQSGTGTSSTDGLRVGLDASSNGIINLNEGTALITSIDGTERMRITNTGIACFACQVCAPTYSATGVSRFFAAFDTANTGYRYMEVANCGASMYWGVERSTAAGLIYNSDPYSTVFATTNATNLNFGTNLYKRFSIDCNGISSFSCQVCAPAFVGGTISGTTGTFSTTTADYAVTITNVQDSSQGLLIRTTDNDTTLNILNLQSSPGAVCQCWVDRLTVTKGGNVGLGTTSPCGRLDIASGLRTSSNMGLFIGADVESATGRTNNTRKVGMMASAPYSTSSFGTFLISADNQSANSFINIGGAYSNFYAATDIRFYTGETITTETGTERFRIFGNGIACFACQVCAPSINIYSGCPSSVAAANACSFLLIDSTSHQYIQLRTTSCSCGLMQGTIFTDNGNNAFIGYKEYTNGVAGTYGEAIHLAVLDFSSSDPNNGIYLGTSTNVACGVTNPLMFIKADGKVGIGTTSPASKLSVHGQFRVNTTSVDGDENRLYFNPGGSGDPAELYLYNEAQSNTVYITANGTSKFNSGVVCFGSAICANGTIFSATNYRVSTGTSAGNSSDPAITTGGCTKTGIYFAGSCVGLGSGGNGVLLNAAGTLYPAANGTQDLGTSSLRWCTVYTSDLSLSNGIGNYTIVEGENDLFLYNNNSCKVYKFIIQEVCPEIAPAKRSI